MPSFDHSSDEGANNEAPSTIVPQQPPKRSPKRAFFRSSRSQSREHTSDDALPKFVHRPSMMSLFSDDDEENYLPSARKGLQEVETETVNSVALLGVPQEGSLRVKKSTDQMGPQNNNHASLPGTRAPSRTRRKRLAAASRADIFAAKIASAMDEAASSDSDETFVYDTNRDTIRRPYNLRTSSTISLPVSPHPKSNGGSQRHNPHLFVQSTTNSGSPTVAHPSPQRVRIDEEHAQQQPAQQQERGRRKRSFLGERQGRLLPVNKNDSVKAKNVYLNRWRGGDLDDEEDDEDPGPLIDETTPLAHISRSQQFTTPTPHDYGANRRLAPFYIRVTLWVLGLVMCVLFCTFVVGVLVASSRPLLGIQIARLVDVFPSDKELVLSVIVQAKNPGCFTVGTSSVDLDLFATSQYLNEAMDPADIIDPRAELIVLDSSRRAVLLGNVQELESPLVFAGSLFNPKNVFSMSTLRLVSPCANATELWQQISTNTFELTVRGVIKYSLLFSQDLRSSVSSSIVVTPE